MPWSSVLEPGAAVDLAALVGKPVLALGPQLREQSWHPKATTTAPRKEDQVTTFLDRARNDKGERSAMLISFGS